MYVYLNHCASERMYKSHISTTRVSYKFFKKTITSLHISILLILTRMASVKNSKEEVH